MEKEISLARVDKLDIGIEDHGCFFMFGGFEYEGGGSWQGFGYIIDEDFIRGILKAFSVERLQDCNGRLIYVEHTHSEIIKLIPLNFGKSQSVIFDIKEWANTRVNAKRGLNESPH